MRQPPYIKDNRFKDYLFLQVVDKKLLAKKLNFIFAKIIKASTKYGFVATFYDFNYLDTNVCLPERYRLAHFNHLLY